MISKELLSEVLASPTKVKYFNLRLQGYGNNVIVFDWISSIDGTTVEGSINIYELAFKCKEYAECKGYNIKSYIDRCHSPARQVGVANINELIFRGYHGQDESEPEAIFKACQWILDKENEEEYGFNNGGGFKKFRDD